MVRVSQIGLGYWGANHLKVWKEFLHEGKIADIIVFDKNPERLNGLGVKVAASLDAALSEAEVIDLVTPPEEHYDLLKKIHNLSVFVEKPLALNTYCANSIVQLALHETNLKIMVGHLFRYHAGVNLLKEKIHRGDFGNINYMRIDRDGFRLPRKNMGVLDALAIHDVDLFAYLLGDAKVLRLTATAKDNIYEGVYDIATLQMSVRYVANKNKEVFCIGNYNWLCPGGKKRHLYIGGEKQSAELDFNDAASVKIYDAGIATRNGELVCEDEGLHCEPTCPQPPLTAELEAFIDFANGKTDSRTPTLDVGVNAVKLIDCAKKSIADGKTINLDF